MIRSLAVLVAVLLGASVAALAAQAGPPGKWTRVTDPNGRNIDEVGLARGGNGVLHAFWLRRNSPSQESLRHTPITAAGKVGGSSQVVGGLRSVDAPDAVVLGDGRIQVFYAGLGSTNPAAGVMAATGSAAGTGWKPEGVRVSSSTNAAASVGVALAKSGDPVFAYTGSFVLAYHVGIDPAAPDSQIQVDKQCCDYQADLATDAASGQTWIAYYSNAKGRTGTWVRRVLPSLGAPALVPGSATGGKALGVDQRIAITGRLGAPGVFVATCQGYPTCKRALLWRIGGKALTVGSSPDVEDVSASPGPDGRLWVAWHDGRTKEIRAARTNRAATRVGPVVSVKPPPGTSNLWKLTGDGSLGALDLFVSATTGSSLATWHTQVLPPLSLSAKKAKQKVTFRVTDAGDAVPGAKVSYAGTTVTTSAKGTATAPLAQGTTAAKAAKAGYAAATIRVKG